MNTRAAIQSSDASPLALSASFNQSSTSLAVSTTQGFSIFSLGPHPILRTSRNMGGSLTITEMIGNSNYLALVGGGPSPRFPENRIVIWDDAKSKPVITLEQKSLVLGVRVDKKWIVMIMRNSVVLYSFASPPVKKAAFETADNVQGLACLGESVLVFPGRGTGKLQIYELATGNVSIIPAHTGALRAVALSPDGSMAVTASEQGTLLRVFSMINCAKLCELRRGVDPAIIFSLGFATDGKMLAATSDKGTLHVFDLTRQLPGTMLPNSPSRNTGSARRRSQSPQVPTPMDEAPANKWGVLSLVPLLPRIFSDTYSSCSCPFDMANDVTSSTSTARPSSSRLTALGSLPARHQQGLLTWSDDRTIMVVGTGRDGKWEYFRVGDVIIDSGRGDEGTKRQVWREGWKRYLIS